MDYRQNEDFMRRVRAPIVVLVHGEQNQVIKLCVCVHVCVRVCVYLPPSLSLSLSLWCARVPVWEQNAETLRHTHTPKHTHLNTHI